MDAKLSSTQPVTNFWPHHFTMIKVTPLSGLKGNNRSHLLTLITPRNRQFHDPRSEWPKNLLVPYGMCERSVLVYSPPPKSKRTPGWMVGGHSHRFPSFRRLLRPRRRSIFRKSAAAWPRSTDRFCIITSWFSSAARRALLQKTPVLGGMNVYIYMICTIISDIYIYIYNISTYLIYVCVYTYIHM